LRGVAVDELPTARRVLPDGTVCLVGLAIAGWLFMGTMRYWWAWLWRLLGLVSVPVDMIVWLVPVALTIVVAPRLSQRFHHSWLVVVVVGAVSIAGTADVLSPWHEVLSRAVAAAFS
jgi:hypothetical protein